MDIDRSIDIPLYQQLHFLLQDKILLGEWGPGVLMPTEQELCEQYNVSRITVRNALEKLEQNDLIERIQGRGTIVKKRDVKKNEMEIKGYTKSMLRQGVVPSSRLLEKKLIIGNSHLGKLFHLPLRKDYYFWRFKRLRCINDELAVIMNHYVRKKLGDIMLQYDLGDVSFYSLYEEILKQPICDSEGLVTAIKASQENAKFLEVDIDSALIWYRGISYIEGGITVEVNYSLFKSDKFYFETHMYKTGEVNMLINQVNERSLLEGEEVVKK